MTQLSDSLLDIVRRNAVPEPWSEGEKIPWNDPGFSARMLKEHLSQDHDAASRRFETIDRHVAWIHETVLGGESTHVLDLGCGPGLYTGRLAKLGHTCVGIDFGPASISHAVAEAERAELACTYYLADVREADYGEGYGLAMMIYGEINVFRPEDARLILRKARAALAPGGKLLLEPHTFEAVKHEGHKAPSWYTSSSGLFSDAPHLVLSESFWDEEPAATTHRHYVIDAATAEVERHVETMQAYTEAGYRSLIADCGFGEIAFYDSLAGDDPEADPTLVALVATATSS
jgi:SAM-dependent methyltransferase